MWEIAVALLENVAKGEQVEDMKDDVKIVGLLKVSQEATKCSDPFLDYG